MPTKLDRCIKQLIKQGMSKREAYAICGDSTGYIPKKDDGWKKRGRRIR